MDNFGHGLVDGFDKNNVFDVLLSHLSNLMVNLVSYLVGSPLLATSFSGGITRETLILVTWSCFPTPYTSLPSAHYNPIHHISPVVHICPFHP